jgi:hypothetical protein
MNPPWLSGTPGFIAKHPVKRSGRPFHLVSFIILQIVQYVNKNDIYRNITG